MWEYLKLIVNIIMLILIVISTLSISVIAEKEENSTSIHSAACHYRNHEILYTFNAFSLLTCAWCYEYTPPFRKNTTHALFLQPARYGNYTQIPQLCSEELCVWADISDPTVVDFVSGTFTDIITETRKWESCCKEAQICCKTMENEKDDHLTAWAESTGRCPMVWDGWLCWEPAPPDSAQLQKCPYYLFSAEPPHCDVYAVKECWESGNWALHETEYGPPEPYTNYATCTITSKLIFRTQWHVIMHAVSLAMEIPALLILLAFRVLRTSCNRVHCHFLVALALRDVAVILYKELLVLPELSVEGSALEEADDWRCRFLVFFEKASASAVFSWMLCEGMNLHHMIASALSEDYSLWLMLSVGWFVGPLPAVIWAIVMIAQDNTKCWLLPADNDLQWLIDAPRLISLIANVILLTDIGRVLCSKLSSVPAMQSRHTRRAVQATLALAPLFGMQFLITVVRPSPQDCLAEQTYYLCAYIIDGLQGAVVATLFCYGNSDIRQHLFNRWNRHRNVHQIERWNSTRNSQRASMKRRHNEPIISHNGIDETEH